MSDPIQHESLLSIIEEINEAVRAGTKIAAQEIARLITDQLKVGSKPDGSPQPRNSLKTIEAKRQRGVGNISGVDSSVLSDPTNWTLTETSEGFSIGSPRERDAAIDGLEARGYEFIGVPIGADELIEESINAELRKLI
jgi:hypothetical protein